MYELPPTEATTQSLHEYPVYTAGMYKHWCRGSTNVIGRVLVWRVCVRAAGYMQRAKCAMGGSSYGLQTCYAGHSLTQWESVHRSIFVRCAALLNAAAVVLHECQVYHSTVLCCTQ
eukprot:COSAG01_NODE_1812_length_9179_cov_36.648789_3_plen_116_part_00